MMQPHQPQSEEPEPELNGLDEAAALWSECLREAGGDAEVRAAFERWRDEDPAHAEAFERVESARAAVESVGEEPEVMTLRNETLSRIAMRRVASAQPPPAPKSHRLSAVAAALAVAVVGSLGALIYEPGLRYSVYDRAVALATGTDIYRTGIGQRSTVTLDDGSTLALNTDTLVRVDYGESARNVNLQHGQALFEVAGNQSRPFVVNADGHRVTALGTAFDVRKSENAIEVTLIEGRVTVERAESQPTTHNPQPTNHDPQPATPQSWLETPQATGHKPRATNPPHSSRLTPHVLEPGQQFAHAANAAPVVRIADVSRVTSWREGRVIFDDDSLSSVVAEMNRYSRRRIVLGDRRLADLEVSGAFDTGKTSVFVEALVTYFPIRVLQENNNRIVLAWAG